MAKIILATIALLVPASIAEAKLTTENLVKNAAGNPWRCDFDHDGRWGPKQNTCIVRVVWRDRPWIGRAAEAIIGCESQWDENAKNRSSSASGLAQFLDSTWRRYKYRHKSPFNPVYSVLQMRVVRMLDGDFGQWSCARIVGVR